MPNQDRFEILSELSVALTRLGDDELRVLQVIQRRLEAGQIQYGRLDLASDKRSWAKEASEEAADLLTYTAMRIVQNELYAKRG